LGFFIIHFFFWTRFQDAEPSLRSERHAISQRFC
jgi:hypothetical protein